MDELITLKKKILLDENNLEDYLNDRVTNQDTVSNKTFIAVNCLNRLGIRDNLDLSNVQRNPNRAF